MTDPDPATAEWFFPDGLLGFPTLRRFHFEHLPALGPVAQIRSLETPELGFFIADPRPWYDGYQVDVPPWDLEQLGAQVAAELATYVILNVVAEPFTVTLNLLGPLVVNPTTGQARQIIQAGRPYSAQQPITNEVDHARAEPAH
jgi:flagellar assembly factor FliW